ncbi:MAG: hypothetical protein M9920_09590 [Verrucomicrobiae bacterium]|nr:hypothetical protein [Verrucomicrobiae bacterium]
MRLEDFAEITQRIIQKDGFDGFLPTLCLPERRHITVLEGVPDEKQPELRSISLAWAKDKATGEEEFLLAFREDSVSFRVIRSFRGELDERVFPVA